MTPTTIPEGEAPNPAAFPCHYHPDSHAGSEMGGMTLRDYFAGQALIGWLAGDEREKRSYPQEAAYEAYQYADAMLAARVQS